MAFVYFAVCSSCIYYCMSLLYISCCMWLLNTLLYVPFYILLYVCFVYRKKENNRVIQFLRENVHHENWLWYVACVYLAVCGFRLPCCMWLMFILLYVVLVYLAVCGFCIYIGNLHSKPMQIYDSPQNGIRFDYINNIFRVCSLVCN